MQLILNKTCYALFTDGTSFFGDITPEQTQQIKDLQSIFISDNIIKEKFEEKLRVVLFPKITEYMEEKKRVEDIVSSVINHPDFYLDDNLLYYRPIALSIPLILAEKFKELLETKSHHLPKWIKFWCWLSCNPSADSREQIYQWMEKQQVQITPNGLMLCYRRVVKLSDNIDYTLFEFVDKQYNKIKLSKKSTNVNVWYSCNDCVYFINIDNKNLDNSYFVGNLKTLYSKNDEAKVYYTDNYTGMVKFVIGKEVRMERANVNSDIEHDASTGLHVGGRGFSYTGFGDTPVACLVNPKDVVCIFVNDWGKARVCALTLIAILEKDAEWADVIGVEDIIDQVTKDQIRNLEKELNELKEVCVDTKQQELFKYLDYDIPTLPSFQTIISILAS